MSARCTTTSYDKQSLPGIHSYHQYDFLHENSTRVAMLWEEFLHHHSRLPPFSTPASMRMNSSGTRPTAAWTMIQRKVPSPIQNNSALEATTQPVNLEHALAGLPVELQRKILEFLLSAHNVQCQHEIFNRSSYRFELAILRTSRYFHALGQDVFAANGFVYISSYNSDIAAHCENIGHWHAVDGDVHDIRLHIHYAFDENIVRVRFRPDTGAVIVIHADLDRIIAELTLWTICSRGRINLNLDVKPSSNGEPLPVQLQWKLLSPFYKICTLGQTCSVTGAVDCALASTVGRQLTPIVHWQRAEFTQVLELVDTIRVRADRAFEAGNLRIASNLYAMAWDCLEQLISSYVYPAHWFRSFPLNDTVTRDNFKISVAAIIQNLITCRLLLCLEPQEEAGDVLRGNCLGDIRSFHQMQWVMSWVGSRTICDVDFLTAMAAVQCDDVDVALEHMHSATVSEYGSLKYSEASKLIQEWSSWGEDDLYFYGPELFSDLAQYLTKKPVEVWLVEQEVSSPAIVLERYILDGLAYDGPQFKEKFATGDDEDENVLFDKKDADFVMDEVKRKIMTQKQEGQRPSVRVLMAGSLADGSVYSVADMKRLIEMEIGES